MSTTAVDVPVACWTAHARSVPSAARGIGRVGVEHGLPYVLESAFAWRGDAAANRREIVAGANWSAAIKNPFRSFGSTGEGLEAQLTELKSGAHEPILFALHLAHPRIQFADRGKSSIVIRDGMEDEEQ